MKYLAILVISVISLVQADGGHYVPRSVYFIDENGNPSVPRPINSVLLNRVRRQVPIQPFGGFAFPQPAFGFPQVQPGQGGQTSFVSSSQTLQSRFGEDEPIVTGQTQTFHSSGGKFQQTNTVLRPDGTVTTNKQTGRTRRQAATQSQGQGHEDGKTQFQSQTNDAPGGVQFQTQNQPGMTQTQSQGEGPLPQQPHAVPSDRAQNLDNRQVPPPQHQPIAPQGNQNYPQGQPNYPQGQPNYPQGQPYYPQGGQPGGFPFGFGGFGFPQAGFGFPQAGFGFPQPGFGFAPGFQPAVPAGIPQQGVQTGFENRFGEDEVPTGVVGGSQTITSQNGVFHATSSILKPDGQVETTHHSGKFPSKKN